jgi:hypothetical protein
MERLQGTSSRAQRLTALGALAVLAAATAIAFGRVFAGNVTWKVLVPALASAALASAFERRNLLLAAAVSAAGMIVMVGLLVFPQSTWHGVPTLETLSAIRDAARHIGQEARVQIAPTPPLPPLLLAAVTAVWAAIFSAHALATRAGSPLLALVPPVALVAFADTVLEESIRPQYGLLFLAGALAIVFVDGLRRVQRWGPTWAWPGQRHRLSATTSRGARRVAMLALAGAAVLPTVLPGWGTNAIIDLSGKGTPDVASIDPLVSIRASLARGQALPLFDVTTPFPTYYRFIALDHFDGTTWTPELAPQSAPVTSSSVLTTPTATSRTIEQRFTVLTDLSLPGLPMSTPPVRAALGDLTAHYDPEADTIALPAGTIISQGATYSVTSQMIQPTPDDLGAITFPASIGNSRYTQLPFDPTTDRIHQLALEWTQGATNDYERILAIQDRLRSPEFTYSLDVPPRADSFDILSFLTQTKKGFCQQFASAMAVMLRSLDIPARVAVGFTYGAYNATTDTYHVTTDQAHSWVEVLFPGYGWLAFEPTPGRLNPVARQIDDPSAPCVAHAGAPCVPARPGGGGRGNSAKVGKGGGVNEQRFLTKGSRGATSPVPTVGGGAWRIPIRPLLAIAGLLAALALLLIPPARALRRRVRLARSSREPRALILATYQVFTLRAADLGLAKGPGETLEEYRARLASSGLLSNGGLDRLTAIAGRAAYAPEDPDGAEADEATRAADETIRDLRRHTPMSKRILGAYRSEL